MNLEIIIFLLIDVFYFLFFIFLFCNFLVELYKTNLRFQNIIIIGRFLKYMSCSDYILKKKKKFFFKFYKIYYYLIIISVILYYMCLPVNVWVCFDFLIFFDYFSMFFGLIYFIFFSLFLLIFIALRVDYFYYIEYLIIIILLNFFVLFLFKVNDFLFLYVLIEGISLCLYIMAATNYSSVKVSEASVKYFILAVLSSLFFLIGISLIYSCFNTVNFFKVKLLFSTVTVNSYNYYLLIFAFLLILVSFFFKVGAAPFHIWVVEVYHGVTFVTFFFFSVYSKFIFFVILFKLLLTVFSDVLWVIDILLLTFGISSIVIGVIGSLVVLDIRRLLAYGSISHAGFLILSLVNFNFYSVFSFILYLLVYMFLMISFFFIILLLKKKYLNKYTNLLDFRFRNFSLFVSLFLFFVFLSMAGVPPFLGFYSKLYVLLNLMSNLENNIYIVLFILIMNLFGIYVYLRLGVYIFFAKKIHGLGKIRTFSRIITYNILRILFIFNIVGVFFLPTLYYNIYVYTFYTLSLLL